MLVNASENDKLFAKLVPVSLKDAFTNQSRTSHLFLTMEWQDSSAGMYNRKVLAISLTDSNDPFFLYNLHISDDDFQILKANQDLLISFSAFPQHIIDYIEKCLLEEKNPQPRFLLTFTLNEKLGNVAEPSQFDIVEINQFKHLTHLSLKFIAATESTVKQYLGSCFRRLKEEKRQLQNHLAFMEQDLKDKLASCHHALNGKAQELELVRKELSVELNMKDNKHAQELQEERDRLLISHKEEVERLKRESKAKEIKFHSESQDFETKINTLDSLNKEFQDKIYKNDATIRELKSKIYSLEDETKQLKENVQKYKHRCENLNSELKDKQSRIQEKYGIIHDLEQELRSKEQLIIGLKQQIEKEIEDKKSVESNFESTQFELNMHERARKELENEKEKLNKFIIDLQNKSKEITKEEKSKSHLLAKYKKVIEENENTVFNMKREIGELQISLQSKNAEVKFLVDTNSGLQKNINELEKKIKDGENVIKWLHRQLSDNCIVPTYNAPSHLAISPSSEAQKQLAKISSSSPETSPDFMAGNTVQKSVRIETASPVSRKSMSAPSQFHSTLAIDSAYYTSPSGYSSNQATPEIVAGNHKVKFNPSDFEIDPETLNAAFGSEDHKLKHSTAKKPTKPVKAVKNRLVKKS